MKLMSVKVGGKALDPSEYTVSEKKLTLSSPPSGDFELEIDVDIKPQVRTLACSIMSDASFL